MVDTFEIELENTTGVTKLFKITGSCRAYRIPRTQVSSFFANEKSLNVCGVYLLLSDSSCGRSVYVGESEPVFKRIKQHLAKPLFEWEEAVVFVGNGGGLTWGKGDIKYMEHGLYQALKSGSMFKVENGNTPQQSTVVHKNVWDNIIEEIKVLVRFLGYTKLFDGVECGAPITSIKNDTPKTSSKNTQKMTDEERLAYRKFEYSVGGAISSVVQELYKTGKFGEDEFKYFLSDAARTYFHTRGNDVMRLSKGHDEPRFVRSLRLRYKGKDYLLGTEFFPESFKPFIEWITKFGLTESDAKTLCVKYKARKQIVRAKK